jgi:hypothetical protein
MTVLLIIMAVQIIPTVVALADTLSDRRAVCRRGGDHTDAYLVFQDVRRESFRLFIQILLYVGLCAITQTFGIWLLEHGFDPVTLRNGILFVVSFLLGMNSMWDNYSRRQGYKRLRRKIGKSQP